jgi:hypothetical protein
MPEIHWHIEPDEPRFIQGIPHHKQPINVVVYPTPSVRGKRGEAVNPFTRASTFEEVLDACSSHQPIARPARLSLADSFRND